MKKWEKCRKKLEMWEKWKVWEKVRHLIKSEISERKTENSEKKWDMWEEKWEIWEKGDFG